MIRPLSQGRNSVTVERRSGEVRIKIHGEFTHKVRKEFRESYYSYPSAAAYVVDMAEVTMMDSSAMGMLIILRTHAGGDQANVSLVNLSPRLVNLIKIAGFQELF